MPRDSFLGSRGNLRTAQIHDRWPAWSFSRVLGGEGRMDQNEDPGELERQIERARRLASGVADQTTSQRLWGFVEELRQKLNRRLAARRLKQQTSSRAHELWEQHGRPGWPGRGVLAGGKIRGPRPLATRRPRCLIGRSRTSPAQSRDPGPQGIRPTLPPACRNAVLVTPAKVYCKFCSRANRQAFPDRRRTVASCLFEKEA